MRLTRQNISKPRREKIYESRSSDQNDSDGFLGEPGTRNTL